MIQVPFFSLQRAHARLQADLLGAVSQVISSDRFILGPAVERFEHEFAALCGVEHAVGVGNGLDALVLILRALDIGPGCEVIVPGHTFIATWLAVSHCGADIVPVDIAPTSFNIDPAAVAAAITSRTRAIIAVHLYGQPTAMDRLAEIAHTHRLLLIEDAAQAHGATYRRRSTGALGVAAAFSFYPTKNLGALGDGGMVTTDDARLAGRVRLLRNYGSRVKYQHEDSGVNSRLDELQAALLLVKLPNLRAANARRQEIAARYTEAFSDLPGVHAPIVAPECQSVWHLYVLRSKVRDALQQRLLGAGIGTMIHYPTPPHRQPAYAASPLAEQRLPESERAASEVLSLPMWPEMEDFEIEYVIRQVCDAAHSLAGVGLGCGGPGEGDGH